VISKLTFDRLDFDRLGSPGTQLSYGCVVEVAGYNSLIEAGGMAGPGEAERSNPEFASNVDVGQLIALAGGASGWFHDSARFEVGTAAEKIEPREPSASLTGSVSVFLVVTPSVSEYAKRSTLPRRSLYILFGGIILLAVLFRGLYQAYWLDEGLFWAAAAGRTAEVNALLSAGANPDSAWEDGTTAINVAKRNGHKEIMLILRNAGAKQ
jgi:hypothetical protein